MTDLNRLIQSRDARALAIARRSQATIDALARSAFALLWDTLVKNPDMAPRDAIEAAQVQFGGGFAQALADAFSELLQRSIGVPELRDMPIGGLSLSSRLYLHQQETVAEVLTLLREHAAGAQQARELAMRLYDGYNPRDGIIRPLEGRARADLPRELRALTADPKARASLARIVERGQAQAARLKSQALRAAYTEAFDAWERGASTDALRRRMEIAHREKNRYFAERIAQTELARAHQASVGRDLMADETIDVVQVRINPAHPKQDICDLHARANLWGLGAGCYPKAKAPRPPFHPFCWCRLRSMPSLFGARAAQVENGEAAYLRQQTLSAAGRIMGSRDKAQQVMSGIDAEAVINAGRDPMYRLARLGDPGSGHPLVPDQPST